MKRTALGVMVAAALFAGSAMAQTGQTIRQRQRNQQQRIAQGVRSGQLTPRETARVERKEAAINREIRRDRRRNGGTLTPAQKARITRQQNRASRQIYREKHDNQHF